MSSGITDSTLFARTIANFSQHVIPATLVAMLCGSLCIFKLISRKPKGESSRESPRFAGPRGVPLLGNILQIHSKQWLQYSGECDAGARGCRFADFRATERMAQDVR